MAEVVKQEGEFKVKPRKMKKLSETPETIKVDLSQKAEEKEKTGDTIKVDLTEKKEEDAVQVNTADESNAPVEESGNSQSSEEVVEEVRQPEETVEETPVIQEITEEEVQEQAEDLQEQVKEEVQQLKESGKPLPENIQKVVDFMDETGGTLEDYVRLNADYSNVDNNTLLREYYRQSKPHLDSEDVSILLEDFTWDEDVDDEKDIRKKKIAYKEEVAKAKGFLEGLKDKYYDEIKLRPGVTQEQQKAVEFFNRYNEEQQLIKERTEDFQSRTKNYFNQDFKGFDFKLGEKKFRYGIKDNSSVANNQSDISNFIKKFLNDKGEVSDLNGYHKALYVANNPDRIINHFYEQGRADAVRDLTAKSKNISNEPRQTQDGNVFINGLRVKSVSGVDSSRLKIKAKR
jgi:ABC-type amino acid transport substrate-binding protein